MRNWGQNDDDGRNKQQGTAETIEEPSVICTGASFTHSSGTGELMVEMQRETSPSGVKDRGG